jgi:hypothetical protein
MNRFVKLAFALAVAGGIYLYATGTHDQNQSPLSSTTSPTASAPVSVNSDASDTNTSNAIASDPDTSPSSQPTTGGLRLFPSEEEAQQHCPDDSVVWLNTNSGIYHLRGERWYGKTKEGAYVCKKEADDSGDRETENGQ